MQIENINRNEGENQEIKKVRSDYFEKEFSLETISKNDSLKFGGLLRENQAASFISLKTAKNWFDNFVGHVMVALK